MDANSRSMERIFDIARYLSADASFYKTMSKFGYMTDEEIVKDAIKTLKQFSKDLMDAANGVLDEENGIL